MKKEYLKPAIKAMEVEDALMDSASDNPKAYNQAGNGTQLSRGSIWNEDDNEDDNEDYQ